MISILLATGLIDGAGQSVAPPPPPPPSQPLYWLGVPRVSNKKRIEARKALGLDAPVEASAPAPRLVVEAPQIDRALSAAERAAESARLSAFLAAQIVAAQAEQALQAAAIEQMHQDDEDALAVILLLATA
jgi:hypothetical protein